MVGYLVGAYRVSERHACRLIVLPRATHRYQSIRDPLTELRLRMRQLAQARIRYGYRKIRVLLIREGRKVGKKLVYWRTGVSVKIAILLEGATEEAFIPKIREFLKARLHAGLMPKLDPLPYDGRIPSGPKLQRVVENLLCGKDPADVVIALTDVYTGTNEFPDA